MCRVLPVNEDGGSGSIGLALRPRRRSTRSGFNGECEDDEPCSRGLAVTAADGVDVDEAVAALPLRGLDLRRAVAAVARSSG